MVDEMDSLDAREMAALFIGYSARGTFDAVTPEDLMKWFEIDWGAAMEVLFLIGSATIAVHFDDCTCPEMQDEDPLADVKVGDPDPLPAGDYECCPDRSGPWHCTRYNRHPGNHIAGDGDEVCAVWL